MDSVHAANAAESKRHWNVLPASLELNVKLAVVAVVTAAGPPVMVVSGGVMSAVVIVQVYSAANGYYYRPRQTPSQKMCELPLINRHSFEAMYMARL